MVDVKTKARDLARELQPDMTDLRIEAFLTDFHNQVIENIAQRFERSLPGMFATVEVIRSYKLDNYAKTHLGGA